MVSNEKRLIEIISTFSVDRITKNIPQLNKMLHIIISHSQQALFFVSSIEEEFNIEIDDEDVNLDNLLDFNKLIKLIDKYV
jgi:acyl carrier protein